MDHEHKEIDARARAEVAMGRDGRYDRSAFAHGPSHHLDHASSPPFSPPPCPPPFRPLVRHRIDREVARPAGRSVDAASLASPAPVGRNVYHASAAAHALRASRRQPVGALVHPVAGMRPNVLEPHCRAVGPQGCQGPPVALDQRLVLARRPCASRGADRNLRVGENEHLLTWPHQVLVKVALY